MFEHRIQHKTSWIVILSWFLMSFNGGFINASIFVATGKFVSHVTGLFTMVGIGLGEEHDLEAFLILLIPAFFMLGAMLSGLLIDRPIYQKKAPHYDFAMLICGFSLLIAALLGHASHDLPGLFSNMILMIFACFACGLQNGALTSSSGASVRTTHLTGLTTDLGLGLARLLTFKKSDPAHGNEVRANSLRLGTLASFVIGAALGTWLYHQLSYFCLIFSSAIAFYAAWVGRKQKYQLQRNETLNPA